MELESFICFFAADLLNQKKRRAPHVSIFKFEISFPVSEQFGFIINVVNLASFVIPCL